MGVAWNHQLGTLAIVRSFAHYVRHPAKAFAQDKTEWRRYVAYKKCIAVGLTRFYEQYPKTSIPPDFLDLWRIYKLIIDIKPKVVVELGGGCSTIAIAYALTKTGGTLYAVDESLYWQDVLVQFMPDELKVACRFSVSDIEERAGISYFVDLPEVAPDLLYVDGGLVKGSKAGGDAIELEWEGMHVIVDGRKGTVDYLTSTLRGNYHIVCDDTQTHFIPTYYDSKRHPVLVRHKIRAVCKLAV